MHIANHKNKAVAIGTSPYKYPIDNLSHLCMSCKSHDILPSQQNQRWKLPLFCIAICVKQRLKNYFCYFYHQISKSHFLNGCTNIKGSGYSYSPVWIVYIGLSYGPVQLAYIGKSYNRTA